MIETFVFGGKTAKATVTIEGTQYELEVTDLRGAEVFKFPITEEDEKFFEENGYMKSRNFWYTTSELNGETLTITVERDYGHNDGLYFSDFTGRTFVLTEQSRVL